MALTESNMLPIGTKAPDFGLLDTVSDKILTYQDIKGPRGTVLLFICNHCPYVIYVNDLLVQIANEYMSKGIGFVAISSNDIINYPADSPDIMKALALELGYPFAYLYDETQKVAKAYEAACTPDIYVFDGEDQLHYRGRIDDSRPGSDKPQTGKDLKQALDIVLAGEAPLEKQYPSAGCNIKWKK